MAKCVKLESGQIVRYSDKRAAEIVYAEKGEYVSKKVWKKFIKGE